MEQSLEHNPPVIDGCNPRYENDNCCYLVRYGDNLETAVFTDENKAVEYAKKHYMYNWKYSKIIKLPLNPDLQQKP